MNTNAKDNTMKSGTTGNALLTLLAETCYTYRELDALEMPTAAQASQWAVTSQNAENGGQWTLSPASGDGEARAFSFGVENIPSMSALRTIVRTIRSS